MANKIIIKGARENNLKNVDIVIPRNKVVCLVGVSGSGKSTLAFDIIAREGQRQYFESLNAYARRYLQKSNRPDVDSISGISSAIVISQDRVRRNPRSTVGTLTEAYTYLRLLYSRVGWPPMDSSYYSFNHPYGACPKCKGLGRATEIDVNQLLNFDKSLNEGAIKYSNWRVGSMAWKIIKASNFFDMDKRVKDFTAEEMDKLLYAPKQTVDLENGDNVINWTYKGIITHLNSRGSSVARYINEEEMRYVNFIDCPECHGGRLNQKSLSVKINGLNIGEVCQLSLDKCLEFVKGVKHKHAKVIKPRLIQQLQSLIDTGVGYLSLNRSTDTLSGGEAQRIKMARQLGCDLIESIYVLDEPTAGLHPRDVDGVIENLARLRDLGNTVIIVEHDESVIKNADWLIELGPGGGRLGGQVTTAGELKDIVNDPKFITGKYLNNGPVTWKKRFRKSKGVLKVVNACRNNLKNLNVDIPTGVLVALTGVSGSGKSSLVEDIVHQHPDKVIMIDQAQIGGNKRGCLGTYMGAFDQIRKIFADENRMSVGLFSFNSHGGCEQCRGLGYLEMDMNFLGDVKIRCESCHGLRYKEKVLRYLYKGKNIAEVLRMTAVEIKEFFDNQEIKDKMDLLIKVGLDYLEIGQTLDTLSGGESQRLKLASRLQQKGEFYILDEPTSGLHFSDVSKLMKLLNHLVDNENTVLIIEHNLEVIRQADWIIDLGPEGGDGGGRIVAQGTPRQIMSAKGSHTGYYLSKQ